MDLDKLRVFHSAAHEGSFTRAGEALLLTQPSVSIHIRDLERSLGVPLFERLGRGVRVTEPGRVLYEYSTLMFALERDAHDALSAYREGDAGEVVIAASSTPGIYLLPAFLAGFRRAHPSVELQLHISDTADAERRVGEMSVDMGVVGSRIEGMENTPWIDDELVLVVSGDHPWASKPPRRADALEGQPFILREDGSAVRAATDKWLREQRIDVQTVLTLDGTEAIKRAVAAGMGMTITTTFALGAELQTGELAIVSIPGLPIRRELYLVRNPRKLLIPAAQEAWDALTDTFVR